MKAKIAFSLLFIALLKGAFAQSTFVPLNEDYYQKLDRYEIKAGRIYPQLFTGVKQYKRSEVVNYVDSISADGGFSSRQDVFNANYFANDNWEWSRASSAKSKTSLGTHIYKAKADFYAVDLPEFDLHVNPILYLGMGQDSRQDEPLFVNTRGLELRGMIDKKIGFYTYLTENQMLLPSYVRDQVTENLVVPHEGFWKGYKEGSGVDFLQARGYLSVEATKHINVQFGHDRFFIGNGHRSMILSDNAPPALFFKGNVKVWKLNYFFLLNRFTADVTGNNSGLTGNDRYPDKHMAFHHFSFNVGKKLNIGVFEAVMFNVDSTSLGKFDLAYANPIIFYRAIEQQNGSSDNVLLGLDFKWNLARKIRVYGQLTLDEFLLNNLRQGNGWWANKYGAQLGTTYVDAFGLSNLDIQAEYNIVRPYTYSHGSPFGSYSSYRQALAHPLGANFNELIGIVRYQPLPRLTMTAKVIVSKIGRDTTAVNWGSNVLKDSNTRQQNFNNTIGQGISNDVLFGSLTASWMVKHNLFIDLFFLLRNSDSDLSTFQTTTRVTSFSVRWNIAQRHYEF
jgi:hypothetical protein